VAGVNSPVGLASVSDCLETIGDAVFRAQNCADWPPERDRKPEAQRQGASTAGNVVKSLIFKMI